MMSLIKSWFKQDEFLRYFFNTLWLLSDKFVRMFAGLISTIIVARYLGPENYGLLAYSISIVTLFVMLNHLGLDGLTVRYLVEQPEKEQLILGTVFGLKFMASVLAFLAMLLFSWFTAQSTEQLLALLFVVSFTILLHPFHVIDFYFQSKVKGKYGSLAKSMAIVVSTLSKVILVFIAASPVWFGAAYVLEFVVLAIALCFWYLKKGKSRLFQWRIDVPLAKEMLSAGWLVMFGAIFSTIYKKVDQAMLMWLADASEVGIYAAAAQLSDIWFFVPAAIVASLFPKLIQLHKTNNILFHKRLQHIFDLLFFMGLLLAIATTIIAEPLVVLLFGAEFSASSGVLVIHIWSIIFVFMRALFSKWIHIEQVFVFSLVTQGIGALLNVVANYYIIPLYGATGAAWTTLVSYCAAAYLSLLFSNKTRVIFIMMTKSWFLPFRLKTLIIELKTLSR